MYTSTVLLALIPSALVAAQYGGSSDASSTAASSITAPTDIPGVHTVKVGNAKGELTFTPNDFTAAPGETIEFYFYPQKHSVVQSSFAAPCAPLNQTKGFFSGKYPVTSGIGSDVFTITVNDTKPIWFYCGTGTHCQSGMVGVINKP
jgi:plastocyanin